MHGLPEAATWQNSAMQPVLFSYLYVLDQSSTDRRYLASRPRRSRGGYARCRRLSRCSRALQGATPSAASSRGLLPAAAPRARRHSNTKGLAKKTGAYFSHPTETKE